MMIMKKRKGVKKNLIIFVDVYLLRMQLFLYPLNLFKNVYFVHVSYDID